MSGGNGGPPTPVLHATLIARHFSDGWRGALLRGPSGSGKSDLALRALDAGFRLVADDRVLVWTSGGRVWGRAPWSLLNLMEVRHVDIATRCALAFTTVTAILDLCDGPVDRLAQKKGELLLGVSIPRLNLPGRGATSPALLVQILADADRP